MNVIGKLMDFISNDDSHMYNEDEAVSNCCGARIMHTDICGDCGEHCDMEIVCEKCDGQGINKYFFFTIKCTECDGEGYVYAE